MFEFEPWPKIPRLFRPVTITEKIDGTNACVIIEPRDFKPEPGDLGVEVDGEWYALGIQSRKRLITINDDNYGFAQWVKGNAEHLVDDLGPGRHYGEWWGQGIQRGYGLREKRFSLFNTRRWTTDEFTHPQVGLVPVLYTGQDYSEALVRVAIHELNKNGSRAAPGYHRPEGVVVFFSDANQSFKVTIENDSKPKAVACQAPAMAA